MVQTKLEIKTTGIEHVVLWVNHLEQSTRLYMDLLGMKVNHESDRQAFLWCGERPAGAVPTARQLPGEYGR